MAAKDSRQPLALRRLAMIGTGIAVIVGATMANFIYEATRDKKNWTRAIDRSYFEAVGVVIFMIVFSSHH